VPASALAGENSFLRSYSVWQYAQRTASAPAANCSSVCCGAAPGAALDEAEAEAVQPGAWQYMNCCVGSVGSIIA
jgi:hypothetical protein